MVPPPKLPVVPPLPICSVPVVIERLFQELLAPLRTSVPPPLTIKIISVAGNSTGVVQRETIPAVNQNLGIHAK